MKNEPATRFPLSWPTGWKRTHATARETATFSKSKTENVTERNFSTGLTETKTKRRTLPLASGDAANRLEDQLDRLGATDAILSTNQQLRMDGRPRADQGEPLDPGAAVYFKLNGKPLVLACDKWDRVADNIAALAAHIDALRRIDRYGVGRLEQAFAGYTALPPAADDWRTVFGLSQSATLADVESKFRTLAIQHHPDRGGDPAMMAKLNAARDAAKKELS